MVFLESISHLDSFSSSWLTRPFEPQRTTINNHTETNKQGRLMTTFLSSLAPRRLVSPIYPHDSVHMYYISLEQADRIGFIAMCYLEIQYVLSDESHYSHYECLICQNWLTWMRS